MKTVAEVIKEIETLKEFEKICWKIISKTNCSSETKVFVEKTLEIDTTDIRKICSYFSSRSSMLQSQLYDCEVNM